MAPAIKGFSAYLPGQNEWAKKEFIPCICQRCPSANQSIGDENLGQFMQYIGSLILLTVFPDNSQREHIQR